MRHHIIMSQRTVSTFSLALMSMIYARIILYCENQLEIKSSNVHLFIDLRKVYPYYFTFTTFTKGRWVGERILDVFAREFRAHPATEYVRIDL